MQIITPIDKALDRIVMNLTKGGAVPEYKGGLIGEEDTLFSPIIDTFATETKNAAKPGTPSKGAFASLMQKLTGK